MRSLSAFAIQHRLLVAVKAGCTAAGLLLDTSKVAQSAKNTLLSFQRKEEAGSDVAVQQKNNPDMTLTRFSTTQQTLGVSGALAAPRLASTLCLPVQAVYCLQVAA